MNLYENYDDHSLNQLLTHLIYRWILGADLDDKNKAFIKDKLPNEWFICSVIDLDNTGKYTEQTVQLFRLMLQQASEQFLSKLNGNTPFNGQVYSIQDAKQRLVLIYNVNEHHPVSIGKINQSFIRLVGLQLGLYAKLEMGVSLSAGTGPFIKKVADMPKSYNQAIAALEYRMYTGEQSHVFYFDIPVKFRDLSNEEFAAIHLTLKQYGNLAGQVNMSKEKMLDEVMSIFISERNIKYSYVFFVFSQISLYVQNSLLEQNIYRQLIVNQIPLHKFTDIFSMRQHLLKWLGDIESEFRNSPTISKQRNLIEQVKDYVNQNYQFSITLDQVSKRLFLNASYFSSLFKQETGITFSEYIARVRIDAAKKLLKQDIYKVYEIAQSVGYPDYRTFSKVFRKMVGIAPKDYKQFGK